MAQRFGVPLSTAQGPLFSEWSVETSGAGHSPVRSDSRFVNSPACELPARAALKDTEPL